MCQWATVDPTATFDLSIHEENRIAVKDARDSVLELRALQAGAALTA